MTSAQLSLFDVTKTVSTSYQVGERVKLRKKPLAASYLKKGDIVEIAAIHPLDGSIKFWNERSERWEFIYPEEVARVVAPPTSAELAVGESNAPPGGLDSPTSAELAVGQVPHGETLTTAQIEAVGESNAPPGGLDSPTSAELAVGESKPSGIEDDCLVKAISTYRPKGTARGGEYFRLSYKDGDKVRTIHIRGGNTDSPIAQAKVQEVRSLLAAGVSPQKVAEMLRNIDSKASS